MLSTADAPLTAANLPPRHTTRRTRHSSLPSPFLPPSLSAMSKRASGASHTSDAAKKQRGDNGAAASSSSSAASKSGPPLAAVKAEADLAYLPGFGCELQSEALPHALPVGQNTPQVSDTQADTLTEAQAQSKKQQLHQHQAEGTEVSEATRRAR